MRHFCAYFDIRYLPRALALYRSLRRHAGEFRLHALCFDSASLELLTRLRLPEIAPFPEENLLKYEPRLADARARRSRVEFIFTCTPTLLLYVLDQVSDTDTVSYVDADLFFYSSLDPLDDELRRGSILIYPHRFPWWLRSLAKYGEYNVGYLAFRRDGAARRCLEWWRDRCIEWCFDRVESGRFADQKYLDAWPGLFDGVVVGRHGGAGLAPWNLGAAKLKFDGGKVFVNGQPLIFYHFQGLRSAGPYFFSDLLLPMGAYPGPRIVRHIYRPYLRELSSVMQELDLTAPSPRRKAAGQSFRKLLQPLLSSYYVLAGEWWRDRRRAERRTRRPPLRSG